MVLSVVLAYRWSKTESYEKPLGLAYLALYAKKYSEIKDIKIICAYKNLAEAIVKAKPGIVGFYSFTSQMDEVEEEIKKIKVSLPDTVFIIGGPHISSLPNKLSEHFDIGVIGEGEESFKELLNLYVSGKIREVDKLREIHGICFWNKDQIEKTDARPVIENIDDIPHPSRELFSKDLLLAKADPFHLGESVASADIFTLRGCPFKCIYCQQAAFGRAVRLHSAEYIVEEIESIYKNYGITDFSFSDDLFTVNRKRMKKIIDLLKEKDLESVFRFRMDVRAGLVDDELIEYLKAMNTASVSMGIETGSDSLMKELKGDGVSIDKVKDAVVKINKAGIAIFGCLMIGAPNESLEEMNDTLEFIRWFQKQDKKNIFSVNPFTPLPETEVWRELVENGELEKYLPWKQYDLSPENWKYRKYHICRKVSKEELGKILNQVHVLRMKKYYKDLFFASPINFFIKISAMLFRKSFGKCLGK